MELECLFIHHLPSALLEVSFWGAELISSLGVTRWTKLPLTARTLRQRGGGAGLQMLGWKQVEAEKVNYILGAPNVYKARRLTCEIFFT